MAVNFNTFVTTANSLKADSQLRTEQDSLTELSGFKKFCKGGDIEANRATASAFLESIRNDSKLGPYLSSVKDFLEDLIQSGKPLTAQTVKNISTHLNQAQLMHNIEIGKDLASRGIIPTGHGTAFAQYALAYDLSLDSPAELDVAVKRYLFDEIVKNNLGPLTTLSNCNNAEQGKFITEILLKSMDCTCEDFFAHSLDSLQSQGTVSFASLKSFFADEHVETINLLKNIDNSALEILAKHPQAKELVETLALAMPQTSLDKFAGVASDIINYAEDLSTPGGKNETINQALCKASLANCLALSNLSLEVQGALSNNQELLDNISSLLDTRQVCTAEQIQNATSRALEDFMTKYGATISELSLMASNNNLEIDPPFTEATLPLYLNVILGGDKVIEPLLNDSVELNSDFLAKLESFAKTMPKNPQKAQQLLNNTLEIILARRGVEGMMFSEIMYRAKTKFGELASNLHSLAQNCKQNPTPDSLKCADKALNICNVLESYGRAVSSKLDGLQQSNYKLDGTDLSVDRFIENNFRKNIKAEWFLDSSRDFASSFNINLPPKHVFSNANIANSKLFDANQGMAKALLDGLMPEDGSENPPISSEFRELFLQVQADKHLDNLVLEDIDISAFALKARNQANAYCNGETEKGNSVDPLALREVIYSSISEDLEVLSNAVKAIDDPRFVHTGIDNIERPFSPEEKDYMKIALMSGPIRDAEAITKMTSAFINTNLSNTLKALATPLLTEGKMIELLCNLTDKLKTVLNAPGRAYQGQESAMRFVINMALESGALSNEEAARVLENLSSDNARNVAGAMMWTTTIEGINERAYQTLFINVAAMNCIRQACDVFVNGNSAVEPLYYNKGVEHASEVSGGVLGAMHALSLIAGSEVISETNEALSAQVPPLTREEWNFMASLISDIKMSAGNHRDLFLVSKLIANSSHEILDYMQSQDIEELSHSDLYKLILGKRAPRGYDSVANFGEILLNDYRSRYETLYKKANPNVINAVFEGIYPVNMSLGISPRKALDLLNPRAILDLSHIHQDMSLSSLADYNENNAFGLTVDFRRQNKDSTLVFKGVSGFDMSIKPHDIPDRENNPQNPEFNVIMHKVGTMTQSYAQFARVLQAFSQASMVMPRMYSTLFAGTMLDEHGNFETIATQRDDGVVVIDSHSDEKAPLVLRQQYLIYPDGTNECTKFTMNRQ